MDKVKQEVDRLYKRYYEKLTSFLLYYFQGVPREMVEDVVQDSFSRALSVWKNEAIPDNPAGWIFKVCRNNALNKIKGEKKIRSLPDHEDFYFFDAKFSESFFDDQQLKQLFLCAHPDLSPKSQVIVTLKYVANFKVEAIAKTFAMTIDGVDKLLLRARQKIKDYEIQLKEPDFETLRNRIPIVHKIIYLIFNEGYRSSWGKEILREELCEEALLLNKALLDSGLGDKTTQALHALMLFNVARFKARFGGSGELLDLEEQDRSLWNKELIGLAGDFLKQSRGDDLSTYHYEASIAYLHCSAQSFESTDWKTISGLYRRLLEIDPNPFIELNLAIALYYSGQRKNAFMILNELERKPFLNQYYLLNATLGKINQLEGNYKLAKEYFLKTLQQTNFQLERDLIQRKIDRIDRLLKNS